MDDKTNNTGLAPRGQGSAAPKPTPPPAGTATRLMLTVEAFADRFSHFVVARRVWVIAATLILAVVLGLNLRNAQSTTDTRVFFGKDNPELIALNELETTYTRSDNVFFVITAKNGTIFTSEGLKALSEMTDDVWRMPYVLRVDSLANFQTIHSAADEISVKPLYEADETLTADRLSQIRDEALSEKELVKSLISADGTVAGISMLAVLPKDQADATPVVAKAAHDLADKWRARWPSLEVRMTGGIIADMTFAEAGDRDERTLIPPMAILLFGALGIGLRSIRATLVVMTAVACAVIAGLGTATFFGAALNAGTASSPIAIMVLTVASAVHLLLGWTRAGARGLASGEAVAELVKTNFAPIAATSVTTIIGFLSLNFSDSPPLRELGNIVAAGTLFCWLYNLTLLPALISFVPPAHPVMIQRAAGILSRLATFVVRRPIQLLLAFAVLTGVLGYGATRLDLDDNYIRYFSDRFEFRRDTDYTEQHLTGLNAIQYSLDSGSPGGVFDPVFLDKVDRFTQWLESQPDVVFVDAIPGLIKRLNQAMEGDSPDAYRIAATREENAQNFLLYEISLPPGQELTNSIDIDRAKTLVTAIVRGGSSKAMRHLASLGENWLKTNTPDIAAPASGLSVAFSYVSERNIKGMVTGTLFAFMLVSFIMLAAFQNVTLGLLSLIPNIVPGLEAFGLWGYVVGDVNLAATVVTSMTFGIIVDDTIHITMRYLRARRVLGESPQEAVRHTIETVGFAVVLTSVAIGAGFAVIATSAFQLSQYLGGLTVLVIFFALIADLLLWPSIILVAERIKR